MLAFPIGTAMAGHPLGTEDAGTLGRGNFQVELNYERAHGPAGRRENSLANGYACGLASNLDLALTVAYLRDRPEAGAESVRGFGDTELSLKAALSEGKGSFPAIGAKAAVSLPTGDHEKGLGSGRAGAAFALIAGWEAGKVLLHANAGGTVSGRPIGSPDRDDFVRASFAAEFPILDSWTAVAEYLWEKPVGASNPPASELTLGGKLALPGAVSLDAGIRWGLSGDAPDVSFLAGICVGFAGTAEPAER